MAKSSAVIRPNLGLYFDRPSISMNDRMLADGMNFRIKEGKLSNLNLGYDLFSAVQLNGPVMVIRSFTTRAGVEHLIVATTKDICVYINAEDTFHYLTPIYNAGTAAASGTAVTGTTTLWDANAKAGDQISFGANDVNEHEATWFEIDSVDSDTGITLTASAGTVVDGPYTIRKLFTGDLTNLWDDEIFVNASPSGVNELWLTNGIDDIVRWDGASATVEVMSALNFKAKILTVFKNMMIFGNITQGGTNKTTDIINSNPGEPQNVTTGISEQFQVHGGTDPLIAMKPIGDVLALYSKENVVIAHATGDDLVFIFRNAIATIGCKAHRGIADFGNYHEFIGSDSQYIFDGVSVKEINPHVWREIIRQQDPLRVAASFAHFDDENGDLIWSVPSTSDPGSGVDTSPAAQAYSEHYLEGKMDPQYPTPFSKRAFAFTAAGYYSRQSTFTWANLTQAWSMLNFRWNDQFFFTAFPLNLVGDADGWIYTLNTSQDANDVGLDSFVTFGRRAVIDGKQRGLITRVYPFLSPFSTPINVTLYLSDHAMGVATITDTQSFDQSLPEGGHFTAHYRRGRFFQLSFSTTGTGKPWELSGFDFDVRQGGHR